MQKNILKERKKVFQFLSLLLIFSLFLNGCNWLDNGIINILDPKAQIIVEYTEISLDEGTIDLEVYSLNEVELIGNGFNYKYYNKGTLIPELTKTVGAEFYVAPSSTPGSPGPITEITDIPLYFQEVIGYVKMNPFIEEINCNLSLIGIDGAGHNIIKSVTFDLPVIQPGADSEPPTAIINVIPDTSGIVPFTVQFDASNSTDNRGIESYHWDFGDGNSATGITATYTYDSPGIYIVTLTVIDYFGNEGFANITIGANEPKAPLAVINTVPTPPTGSVPLKVYFDAYGSESEVDIVNYYWEFGDGSTGTGITTNHIYDTPGTYLVYLTVTDSFGNEAYDFVEVEPEKSKADVEVTANPPIIPENGSSTITATCTDDSGNIVSDGTYVVFGLVGNTSGTTLEVISGTTISGAATATLTMKIVGTVNVMASTSYASGSTTVTCQ